MKIKNPAENTVGIEFKVWCPSYNRVTRRLFLLGSLAELGAWSIDDALEAYPTSDIHIWKVEANVPASSSFEWVWVLASPQRKQVEWEKKTRRSRSVDGFSGTLHTIFGEEEEVFLQRVASVELSTYRKVDEGNKLVLVGSTPTTGSWDVNKAIAGSEFPKKSGYWKAYVTYDAQTNLSFKWTIVKEKEASHVVVQEKETHQVYGRHAWMRAVAPWNQGSVVVVDTSIMDERSDHMLGRTDILCKEKKIRQKEIRMWHEPHRVPTESSSSKVSDGLTNADLSQSVGTDTMAESLKGRRNAGSRIPTVKRTTTVGGNVKQKPTVQSKTELLTVKLNKTYDAPTSGAIKGKGQTSHQPDFSATDVGNQVPLLDGGLAMLMSRKDGEQNIEEESHAETEEEGTVSLTTHGTSSSKAQRRVQLVDSLLEEVEKTSEKITALEKRNKGERDGIPVIEENVSLMTSVPPTWSMMQEDNIEQSKRPTLVYNPRQKAATSRTAALKQTTPVPPMTVSVVPEASTLWEKLKRKSSSKKTSPVLTKKDLPGSTQDLRNAHPGTSVDAVASIGTEDMLKTSDELEAERENQQMWKTLRAKQQKELEKTEAKKAPVEDKSAKKK